MRARKAIAECVRTYLEERKRLAASSNAKLQGTSRTHFMQAVNEELAKFERCEREFRKKDRDERAKGLQMPIENTTPKIGA
jgi:hypothetical protein